MTLQAASAVQAPFEEAPPIGLMNKYAHFILRYRVWVIALTVTITALLGTFGAGLKVVIDPAALAPQGHPLIQATNNVEQVFGSKYLMIIGTTPKQGDLYQPAVHLKLIAGLDYYYGPEHTFFGQLSDNRTLYVQLQYGL